MLTHPKTAANFTILGIIIRLLGTHYSWLSPRMCTYHAMDWNEVAEAFQTSSYFCRSTSSLLSDKQLVAHKHLSQQNKEGIRHQEVSTLTTHL